MSIKIMANSLNYSNTNSTTAVCFLTQVIYFNLEMKLAITMTFHTKLSLRMTVTELSITFIASICTEKDTILGILKKVTGIITKVNMLNQIHVHVYFF